MLSMLLNLEIGILQISNQIQIHRRTPLLLKNYEARL